MNLDIWNNCLNLLYHQKFKDGWIPHEHIPTGNYLSKNNFSPTPTYNKPIWKGNYVEKLLVNCDFGMGDTIQFYRFVQEVKKYTSCLILRTDEEFFELFSENIIKKEEPIPNFDQIIHLMSAPYVLKIEKVYGDPYLSPNPKFPPQESLFYLDKMKFAKIGICWQGNPFNPRDKCRSIPLKELSFLPDLKFFSLNKIGEIPSNFIDMKNFMHNWNETAHLLKKLDLVISVDTAIIHLAGALGVPAWLLLKENEWRWGKEEKSIWYNSVKIFRGNTWENIINQVNSSLWDNFVHATT